MVVSWGFREDVLVLFVMFVDVESMVADMRQIQGYQMSAEAVFVWKCE